MNFEKLCHWAMSVCSTGFLYNLLVLASYADTCRLLFHEGIKCKLHQLEFWFLALLISVFLPVGLYAEHNQVLVASELGFLWFSVVNTHINGGQTQVKSWDVFAAILCIVCLSIFKLQSLGLLEAQTCRFFRVLLFQSLLVSIGLLPESFIHVTNSDPPVDNSAQWWCVRVWGNETWYSLFSTSIQRAWGRSFENAHVEGWLLL